MKTLGLAAAQRAWSQLITDVEAGETVVLTRRGKPVAKIVPTGTGRLSRSEAIDALERFADERQLSLAGLSIKDLVAEGRP